MARLVTMSPMELTRNLSKKGSRRTTSEYSDSNRGPIASASETRTSPTRKALSRGRLRRGANAASIANALTRVPRKRG